MCIWNYWKKPKTRKANLIKCDIPKGNVYECGNTCLGYWRITDSWITIVLLPTPNYALLGAGPQLYVMNISDGGL